MKKVVETMTYSNEKWITNDGVEYQNEWEAVQHEAMQKLYSIPNASLSDVTGDFYVVRNEQDVKLLWDAYQYRLNIGKDDYPVLVYAWRNDCDEYFVTVVDKEEVEALKNLVSML